MTAREIGWREEGEADACWRKEASGPCCGNSGLHREAAPREAGTLCRSDGARLGGDWPGRPSDLAAASLPSAVLGPSRTSPQPWLHTGARTCRSTSGAGFLVEGSLKDEERLRLSALQADRLWDSALREEERLKPTPRWGPQSAATAPPRSPSSTPRATHVSISSTLEPRASPDIPPTHRPPAPSSEALEVGDTTLLML